MHVFFHSAQRLLGKPEISLDFHWIFPTDWAYTAFFFVYAQKTLEFWA